MANKQNRWSLNSNGKFYVDDQCIACDACIVSASHFFEMNDDEGYAYVKKQPANKKRTQNLQ